VRDRVEPDSRCLAVYEDGYARYRQLYPALKSLA
jgi:sugar (pentulose or hexulose) kinase